jgi:hypothetical protein
MAEVIYLTAAATCLFCTVLLLRQWRRSRLPLLFWSGVCFLTLTAANILLFVDRIVTPTADLSPYRNSVTLLAILFMLWGLIMGRKER